MGAQLATKGAIADLNLTPLIDIVLVVLIIMMVNIPIQVEEMGIKLPSNVKVQVPTEVPPEQLVIAVYEDGSLGLNRRLMTEEVLFYEVTRRLRPMAHKNVFIDAYPTVKYGRVVDMMDLSREAGASKVGLARLKPDGPLAPVSVAPGSLPKGVHVGLALTVGVLSQRQSDRALKPYIPTIEHCYEKALSRNHQASGRIMLRVTVAPDASIMATELGSSNVEDAELDACVLSVAELIEFPTNDENKTTIVQFPLLFSPG